MRYCAGIDLGTTNTVLSVWEKDHPRPKVIGITQPASMEADDFASLPSLDSVVTLFDDQVWVGAGARHMALVKGSRQFASIKRFMGHHWFDTYRGEGWTPERVSACILRVVHDELANRYGAQPERLVVTIPASFGSEARRATLAAAALAGFAPEIVSLFDEPTAALLAQRNRGRWLDGASQRDLHAVVDIGGGTLDVSLVRVHSESTGTCFDVIGQSRYNEIAGDDFDLNIAGLLLHRFQEERQDVSKFDPVDRVVLCWELLQGARKAKHNLSDLLGNVPVREWANVRESIHISQVHGLAPWRTELSGADLVDALREYFPATQGAADAQASEFGVFRPIQECLDSASRHEGRTLHPRDVTHVWLTGGSARLPPFRIAMKHLFGAEPRLVDEPMQAVALGAAWKAGIGIGYNKEHFEVRERTFDGVFLNTGPNTFHPLVPVNQKLPMPAREYSNLLAMPQPDDRIMLELYMGMMGNGGQGDMDLTPLSRRIVTFPEILPPDTRISLTVALTEDRQLSLKLTADVGRPVEGRVSLSTAPGWSHAGTTSSLPAVNRF